MLEMTKTNIRLMKVCILNPQFVKFPSLLYPQSTVLVQCRCFQNIWLRELIIPSLLLHMNSVRVGCVKVNAAKLSNFECDTNCKVF